jgi:signal transduction histidine kinase
MPEDNVSMLPPTVRAWAPDLAVGFVVLLLGLWEAYANAYSGYDGGPAPLIVAVGAAIAVGVVRFAGWWSLGILWALLVLQAVTMTDIMLVELAVIGVAFGLARWGSRALLWASGISIPIATFFALGYVGLLANGLWGTRIARNLIVPLIDSDISWPLVVLPMIAGVLALPWFAGLAARYWGAARASERSQSKAEAEAELAQRERARMREIAVLREGQARLARDVHDVVGHSLTVILAQAESAQFLDNDDPVALKRTMATIASSARSSLQEVRAVLASPDGDPGHRTDLDTLIDATRASGNEISVTDTGVPRPLPPELATVAFRVLQEMLTNAIKHGRRDGAITVTRDWGERLGITVTNHTADDGAPGMRSGSGNGIGGMRRRLESVGGSLEVRETFGPETVFTAAATLPMRPARALETVAG